jgi:hypothetical protein
MIPAFSESIQAISLFEVILSKNASRVHALLFAREYCINVYLPTFDHCVAVLS